MAKKKLNMSIFSSLIQQINSEPSSAEYHLIDNEYFAAFNSLNDIQQFHNKIIEKQPINNEEDHDLQTEGDNNNEMDMKTFAQQFLIDPPEPITTTIDSTLKSQDDKKRKESSNIELSSKRQRRNIRDLPQSSNFIFMSDDDHGNIFNSLKEKRTSSSSRSNRRIAYEDISSILLTLDVQQKKKKQLTRNDTQQHPTIAIELAEPSIIKTEPIEQEHVC
jgi:hypothetical protein